VVKQIDTPERPPCATIGPDSAAQLKQMLVHKLRPLKHDVLALPQLIPTLPQTKLVLLTVIVFLAYPPGFPGMPPPQHPMFELDPLAPQISITAVPFPGAIQQKSGMVVT
jgi:hypothetical protein